MNEVKFTRQELYDLIWSEPMSALTKKYNITDIALRQKCRKLEIPIPNNGDFIRARYLKKAIEKRPLGDFTTEETVFLKLRETKEVKKLIVPTLHEARQNEIENDKRLNLTVPKKLINPDPLVVSVRDDLQKLMARNGSERIVSSSRGELLITVSPHLVGRALCFMDTFIKALKSRGHQFCVHNGQPHINIDGEKIEVCCREKLKRIIVKGVHYDSTEYAVKGLLSLKIVESYSNQEWVDGKKLLEEKLPDIISFLELKTKKRIEQRLEYAKYNAEHEEKRQIANQIQERKEKELADFKDLFKKAQRHDKADMIRKYAAELERNAVMKNKLTAEVIKEIEWARHKADWYDPFIEADDELLQDVDKEDLTFKKKSWWG